MFNINLFNTPLFQINNDFSVGDITIIHPTYTYTLPVMKL